MAAELKTYSLPVATSDIPNSWMSSAEPRVHSGGSKRYAQISSQNGTVTSGGQLIFPLPVGMGAGFMTSGSAYLKFNVTVTQAAAFAWAFRNLGCGSSVVFRMTAVLSGVVAEQIQHYSKLYASLLSHATSYNFAQSDSKISENTLPGAFNTTAMIEVCVPVGLGTFNAKHHLPLFLLSAGQLVIDLENVVNAITSSANVVSEYSVSNAQLIFEQLIPDSGYEMAVKQLLGSRVYSLPINSWYNNRFSNTGALSQIISVNTSSLRCVMWNCIPQDGVATSAGHFTDGGQTQAQLMLDGSLVHNGSLLQADTPQQFLEMKRCLCAMYDSDRTSFGPSSDGGATAVAGDFTLAPLTRANYVTGAYLGGLSTHRTNESGFSFVGSPCNQATLNWQGTAGGNIYVYCARQSVLTIDANTAVNIVY